MPVECPMANVLITDLLEESGYLLRSLLRGRGHAASIAITAPEANAKLETGLFDTLFIDLCEPTAEKLAIVQYANDLLPGMPCVALTTEAAEEKISGVEIFGKVYRPIRGSNINETTERAIQYALNLGKRRNLPRVDVDFPIELEIAGDSFTARATDISPKGIALDGSSEVFTKDRIIHLLENMEKESLSLNMKPRKKENYSAKGRIAFLDSERRYHGKMIGVIFEDVQEDTQAYVDSYFKIEEDADASNDIRLAA